MGIEEFEERLTALVQELAANAPGAMWSTNESIRRLRLAGLPDGDDIVRTVYGSEDFRQGGRDCLGKRPHQRTGR